MTPEYHAVFATDGKHNTFRVSDPLPWGAAQDEWSRLDDLRRAGRLPQAKFFEVRSVTLGPDRPLVGPEIHSHDRYDGAGLNMNMTRVVIEGSRGYADDNSRSGHNYTGQEKAARVSWKNTYGKTFTPRGSKGRGGFYGGATGVQGHGGWYYYPNGCTAAQGTRDLARLCVKKCLVVEGVNGKWYPIETQED
jgi:hypothetical protein